MENHRLRDVLSEAELHQVLKKALGIQVSWQLIKTEIQTAVEGMSGFLGDHFRLTLHVKINDYVKRIKLFVKTVPLNNKPKSEFIHQINVFKTEAFMFKLLDELNIADGINPWCTRAYLMNENVIVMPDLDYEGYVTMPNEPFDLCHVQVAITSIARFHATFANYESQKSKIIGRPYCFLDEHAHIMKEFTFKDSDWIRTGATLNANFLKVFSRKYKNFPNLETKLRQLFVKACEFMRPHDGTFNTLIHRDLWSNNLMFKCDNGVPENAIILDFQLIRYTPPSFDVTQFVYLTTNRNFRVKFEEDVYKYYFSVFMENVDDMTKLKLRNLNYDYEEFRAWCDKSRLFAVVMAIMIFPYVLMDPKSAQKVFDDPETFEHYLNVDRTAPVIEYAKNNELYRERFLEICEEVVEKYIM